MPNNACTPHNAMAKLAALFDSGGVELAEDAFEILDNNAKVLFHDTKSQSSSQTLQAARPDVASAVDEAMEAIAETDTPEGKISLLEKARGGAMDLMKPTDYLPDNVTKPVFDFLNDFFARNHTNMKGARNEYLTSIRSILRDVEGDLENLSPAEKGQAKHWIRDLREGYPFYGKGGNIIGKGVNNALSNVLDLSGTIIAGNPLEFIIKAPSLYGIRPTFSGLAELTRETGGNLWAKLPELEKAGVYGIPRPNDKRFLRLDVWDKLNDGIIAVTDRPLKNLAYFTGKAQGGTGAAGLEAVEKVAYKNMFGNDAKLGRRSPDAIKLMNYTFNTYHMLGGIGKGLLTPGKRLESARQLGMWMALTGGIGGPAAIIPEPIALVLRGSEGFKEWEKENINTAGKLIRPGGLSFGVGYELINRVGQVFFKDLKGAAAKIEDDDMAGAMLDLGDSGISLTTALGRNPLGNARIQKVLRNTRDLFEGDIDFDEYKQKVGETFLPALKEK